MTNRPSIRPPQAPGSRCDAIVIGAGFLALLHQPELAPPGKTGLIVTAMASWQFGGG